MGHRTGGIDQYRVLARGLRLVAAAAALLAFFDAGAAFGQAAGSGGYVQGSSTFPIGFDQPKWCEGGTEPGSACAVSGDCAGGGTCVEVWVQAQAPLVPSWALTRNEGRTVGTSAVDAFSSAASACWSVRVQNRGTTTLAVGWSGVSISNAPTCEPGEWCQPMYPPNRDCNAVKIISSAAGGDARVVTP